MMKPWQHGYDIEYLKNLEKWYDEGYNRFSLSPFSRMKKNDIAAKLHNETFKFVSSSIESMAALIHERVKVRTPIRMHGDVTIGYKEKGDIFISNMNGRPRELARYLSSLSNENIWVRNWIKDEEQNSLLRNIGFRRVGGKITTFGEIYSFWFKDRPTVIKSKRKHPKVDPVELIGLRNMGNVPVLPIEKIQEKLKKISLKYTNHYSNYNEGKSWSAISLKGYTSNPAFITKPMEMSKKWKEDHRGEDFILQDTELRSQFPEVNSLLESLGFGILEKDIHRIRFMKLGGSGQLGRHTDQVDKEAYNTLGGLIRLHFPIVTNNKVKFYAWLPDGAKQCARMVVGECWMLDTRKPHMVTNEKGEDRIHLVIDVVCNENILERLKNE